MEKDMQMKGKYNKQKQAKLINIKPKQGALEVSYFQVEVHLLLEVNISVS